MKNTSLKSKVAAGFSLVELLVVIAVIGVIAAIAIPNIGSITGSAKDGAARRNAQNIASVYSSAKAAGATIEGADKATVAGNIVKGVTINEAGNPFDKQTFSVPNMSADEQSEAVKYLLFDASKGGLSYISAKQP